MSQTGEDRQDHGESMKKDDEGLADGPEKCVRKKKKDDDDDDDDEDPLRGLVVSPHTVLEEAHHTGRLKCSTCGSSRLLYCYTCCCLVGLDPQLIPNIKLPVKIDIIKHPNETDGKSTAVHAKLIAPDDVSIYTYPCIPELDTHSVVLVFPGPDSMTVEELVDYISQNGRKRGAERFEERETKKPKLEETSDCSHTHTHTSEYIQEHTCPIQRVIFIDSTWNQTTKIITDERLQEFPRVELKSRKTCFWRHQRGCPNTYLSTIEAVYYFLKDFHTHCLQREYRGEYDNLLFFYTFLHKLIRKAKQARV